MEFNKPSPRSEQKAIQLPGSTRVSPAENGSASAPLSAQALPPRSSIYLKRKAGNRAFGSFVFRTMQGRQDAAPTIEDGEVKVQRKITVSQPGDPYEVEAERVAELITQTSESSYLERGPTHHADHRRKDGVPPHLKRLKSAGHFIGQAGPEISNEVVDTPSSQPLDHATRSYFEPRFGQDLSTVRVHTGGRAADSAHTLNALAYTVGNQIVFGAGQYAPQTSAGRKLLAHELVHTLQQDRDETQPPAGLVQRQDDPGTSDAIKQAISSASSRFTDLQQPLSQVTYRAKIFSDKTLASVTGEAPVSYPTSIQHANAGFYLIAWDRDGKPIDIADLSTGVRPTQIPVVAILAGQKEDTERRRGRNGVWWVTQTVKEPPPPKPPSPDQLQFPLSFRSEISAAEFHERLELNPPRSITIPGLTGGIFDPEYVPKGGQKGYYARPLNFTFYTHDGENMIVSRRLANREFYYVASISEVQNYLRIYPFEYAGLSAQGMVILAQIMMDVGISFIPIIGPLYGLEMAGVAAYHAYKNWDPMSGWEKGLVGVTVLLSVVPVLRGAGRAVRGARAFGEGVDSLVSSGLGKADARRLMLASGVFQSEKATLRMVDTLSDTLRRGENLSATELAQVQKMFKLMLDRLPAGEKALIQAGFATERLETATEFFNGLELTEQHLTGLRRLSPEVLVILQRTAGDSPLVVQRIATMAARSQEVASAIEKVYLSLGPKGQRFLTHIVTQGGDDVLSQVGREGVEISEQLATYVRNARTASQAYQRLMQGTARAGRDVVGLAALLSRARGVKLTTALAGIESEFSHVFLTTEQLSGLARLNPTIREALAGASDSQLRSIATFADRSSHAGNAINQIGLRLASELKRAHLPGILENLGGGILETAGRTGITLSDDLVKEIARQTTAYKATKVLLEGFARRGTRVEGILDQLAKNITKVTDLQQALRVIEFPVHQANLFSRFAMQNPTLIEGISAISRLRPADAQAKIASIYRAFGTNYQTALNVFKSIGDIERLTPAAKGLDRMVGELAAGAEKTMGASLTLTYAVRQLGGKIAGFEETVAKLGYRRDYDLAANGIFYEFKYWLGFGGRPAAAAADEFARDVIIHAKDGFTNLRWVVSSESAANRTAIESMMRGVVARPYVQAALRAQGLTWREALKRLEAAQKNGLLSFY